MKRAILLSLGVAIALAGLTGALIGASPQTAPADTTTTIIYDVSDLVRGSTAYSGRPALLELEELITGDLTSRPPPGSTNVVNVPPPDPTAVGRDELVTVVKDQVDPGGWGLFSSEPRSIHMVNDHLAVRQTPANQQAVASLLDRLRAHRDARTRLALQAYWLFLTPGDEAKLLKPAPGNAPSDEVDPAAIDKLPASAFFARGQVECRDGVPTQLIAGRIRTVITNLDAQVGTAAAAYQPTPSRQLSGAALQITPRLRGDSAAADLVSFVSVWGPPGEPYRLGQQVVQWESTTRPTTREFLSAGPTATLDRIDFPMQQIVTSVVIPLDKNIVVGGMTIEPDTRGAPAGDPLAEQGRQIFLVLRLSAR